MSATRRTAVMARMLCVRDCRSRLEG
jgi:hypothetical protein